MVLIVVPANGIDLLLRILKGCEPMEVQALVAEVPIERLDRRVVVRLATATGVQYDDAVGVRPPIDGVADNSAPCRSRRAAASRAQTANAQGPRRRSLDRRPVLVENAVSRWSSALCLGRVEDVEGYLYGWGYSTWR